MSRLHMHTTQNQSRGKSCHQSDDCYSRLSSPLLLCKTKLCVCVCVCVCVLWILQETQRKFRPRYIFLYSMDVSRLRNQSALKDCFCFLFLSCCSVDKAVTRSLKQTLPRAPDDSGSSRSEAEPLGQFNRKIRKRGIIDGADLVCLTLT